MGQRVRPTFKPYVKMGKLARILATVAQLVEQRFRKPQVVGSSPTRGSTLSIT